MAFLSEFSANSQSDRMCVLSSCKKLAAMSTYIFMKVLESTPCRYDRGIRILTLGRLDKAYDRLVSHIKNGQRVLDLGCGTGALILKAAWFKLGLTQR